MNDFLPTPDEIAADLWERLAQADKPVVLYGMGNGADKILAVLERCGVEAADFFASDGFVRGHAFHGKVVLTYAEVAAKYEDFIVLLSFGSSLPEVLARFDALDAEREVYAPDVPVVEGGALFTRQFYKENYDKFRAAYDLLCDEESKRIFGELVRYKLTGNLGHLRAATSAPGCERAILDFAHYETMVDAGAYTGDTARKFIADCLNADIMSSLPCQTVSDYKRTLQKVLDFPIRHISSYSLIIEEGTPFYIMNEKGTLKLPDEDEERDMYYMTETLLNEKGFKRYEISNYALPGYECEHNKIYWQRGNYIGFGAGAASLMDDIRYSNVRDVKKYIENPCGYDGIEKLSLNDRMAEYMFLGMRMMSGVSISMFRQLFGTDMMNVYREPIDKHIKEGLLYMGNDRLRLTKKGIDLSNYVFCDFLVG